MKRSAVAYFSNGKLILAPVVRSSSGLGLEVDPKRLDDPRNEDALREAIIQALDGSKRVVPHPSQEQWKSFFKPFHDAAGVRSLKAFMKDARSVSIVAEEHGLRLEPQRNLGVSGGWEEMPEAAISFEREDIGGAVSALKTLLFPDGS